LGVVTLERDKSVDKAQQKMVTYTRNEANKSANTVELVPLLKKNFVDT